MQVLRNPSQPARLAILAAYVILLFIASKLALGAWLPPTTEKGLWFYSGLAALLLGNLLVTPFYAKPADAISYGVAALIGLLSVSPPAPDDRSLERTLWIIAVSYVILVLVAAIISIAFKDSRTAFLQNTACSMKVLTDALGTPTSVFSAVILFALVAFHRDTAREYVLIGVAWATTVGMRPLETLVEIGRRWWEIWQIGSPTSAFGEVVGHETPGIVLVRHEADQTSSFGDLLVVRADDGRPGLALALDHVGFAEGRWLRALHLAVPKDVRQVVGSLTDASQDATALRIPSDSLQLGSITDSAWTKRDELLGLVAPETDISTLMIEVVRGDLDVKEGCLVEVSVGASPTLYQVTNGLTKEEILQQKNTRGYVRIHAKKIGAWDEQNQRFEVVKWIPKPNAPVFLEAVRSATPHQSAIGHFPATAFPVSADVNSLVTHNTAILGILGAGKSFLALELVERMVASKIKVICLDLTNQYADALKPHYATQEAQEVADLVSVGPPGKTNVKQNVEEGGSGVQFRDKLRTQLQPFLAPGDPRFLKIYNPVTFEVWRQDSKMFSGNASMASLTPTEITRIFTEVTLDILQQQGMTDQARCCLVFEEAHSLIPEWSAVASEGDKTATNGTAKAILQGRKYGLGCLVITQRTANVTKSILNQCNTVFALRVFDSTGMEFLRNYIGEDYTAVLSTLEDRHAVVFGRASSCRNPVLIRLNDRNDILPLLRPSTPQTAPSLGP